MYYQTEAWAGEYDIVACDKTTTPPQGCVQEITARFKVKDTFPNACTTGESPLCGGPANQDSKVALIYAAPHCHAPSCISMELYNADTGDLICSVSPVYGQGDVVHNKFDELGYLLLPPCLWGTAAEGLAQIGRAHV